MVRIGLTLYDLYARGRGALPRHRFFGRGEIHARWPGLNPRVASGALYYDAKIAYPERLGIEMVIDTETAVPQALALNHVGLGGFENGAARLVDRLTPVNRDLELVFEPSLVSSSSSSGVSVGIPIMNR